MKKEQVKRAVKIHDEQLRREVNEEREKLGKMQNNDDDDDINNGGAVDIVEEIRKSWRIGVGRTPLRQPNQPYFAYSAVHALACVGREVGF